MLLQPYPKLNITYVIPILFVSNCYTLCLLFSFVCNSPICVAVYAGDTLDAILVAPGVCNFGSSVCIHRNSNKRLRQ